MIKEVKILALLYPVAVTGELGTWALKHKYGVIR